jgi:hypothetical protein
MDGYDIRYHLMRCSIPFIRISTLHQLLHLAVYTHTSKFDCMLLSSQMRLMTLELEICLLRSRGRSLFILKFEQNENVASRVGHSGCVCASILG